MSGPLYPRKLHEAYHKALENYQNQRDEQNHRALFKALLSFLEIATKAEKHDHIFRILDQMNLYGCLQIQYMANQIVWQLIACMSKLRSNPQFTSKDFARLFRYIVLLNHQRPSHEHSLLLRFFLKRSDHFDHFWEFIKWWNIENFRPEDYEPEEYKKVTYPPLIETYYNQLTRELEKKFHHQRKKEPHESELIQNTIREMENLFADHPNFKFFPYHIARLMLLNGQKEKIPELFMEFARKNSLQFWVWETLADFFEERSEKHIALLCRAALCKDEEKMKINVYERLYQNFVAIKAYIPASEMLDRIISIRTNEGWTVPQRFPAAQSSSWYVPPAQRHNIQQILQLYADPADSVLFEGIPLKKAVLSSPTKDPAIWLVITEDLQQLTIKPGKFKIKKPAEGTILEVLVVQEKDKPIIVNASVAADQHFEPLVKTVSGKVIKPANQPFALVKDAYLSEKFVQAHHLEHHQMIQVKAVRNYNHKKKEWGWRGFELIAPPSGESAG